MNFQTAAGARRGRSFVRWLLMRLYYNFFTKFARDRLKFDESPKKVKQQYSQPFGPRVLEPSLCQHQATS